MNQQILFKTPLENVLDDCSTEAGALILLGKDRRILIPFRAMSKIKALISVDDET